MPQILRLIVTILTASFIVINNEQELIFPSLLNQFLIYMGNASYPPNTVTNNIKEAESCLKFYLADTCKEDILIEKYYKKRPFGSIADIGCSYESDPSSNKTLLITGNSFVYYQIQGISEAIKKSKTKFSKIYVIGYTVCNLLAGSLNKFLAEFQCEMIEGSFDDFVAKVKINVIIYTAKIDHMPGFQYYLTRNVSALSEDDGYNAALTSIMKRKSVADKFIIIQPSPALSGVGYQNPLSVARLLFSNRNLSTFDLPIQLYRKKIYPGWDRIKEAAKQCSNCILVETEKIFCNENFCPVIDAETLLARYCDEGHITPTESLKLVPELVSAIDKNIL
uniref:SGNH domain-containing protein n=1 Tax=Panagrolaimus sp. PS1159 TaxID=55785 RepID=A0AC35GHW2_9BILA